MKIEIGESLACSWLRHVRKCWLVQANWKFSEHWERHMDGTELEELFNSMKDRFDRGGGVFKQTKNATQFLQQGEIDVVGVDYEGGIHAAEVAFHEAGLDYGSVADTNDNVFKKMLRTLLILRALHPPETRLHIYFLSPKVTPSVQEPLEATFKALKDLCAEYPCVEWQLVTNDRFTNAVVRPTLDKASKVADSSELFVRSAKLINLAGYLPGQRPRAQRATSARKPGDQAEETRTTSHVGVQWPHADDERVSAVRNRIQPLVRELMWTLLVECPDLLTAEHKRGLRDEAYCWQLGLTISNLPLLRRTGSGTEVNGYNRYWRDPYGDFYVCSQWWRLHHRSNARSLLTFIKDVAERNKGHPEADALRRHEQAFRDYLAGA